MPIMRPYTGASPHIAPGTNPPDGPTTVRRRWRVMAGTVEKERPRWLAGVFPYKTMGYWRPDYEPEETDVIAAFRLIPQDMGDPEEAGAAVAGEPSTAPRT